jgi:hypothetical protein
MVSTWRFRYQTANPLSKGATVKFDLLSLGRQIDWEIPTSSLRSARNVIYGETEGGTVVSAKEVETPDSYAPQFEFILPELVKPGEHFTIVIGSPPKKGKGAKEGERETGNRAQTSVQRRRQFAIYVDPKGKGNYEAAEHFTMDIKGSLLRSIRVLTPAVVVRNKRFDVIIRFEDEFGNLTANAPEGTLIDLSYENIRESLNWKLFVPETGFVTLPNLYFNEPGVYRLRLQNLTTQEVFVSAPIKCFADTHPSLFWGLLHGESERVDSTESIETCLRHFRDERNLNFFASSPFESTEETPNEIWKLISQNIMTFNEEERFASFLGFQWKGSSPAEGLRQFLYAKDGRPILRAKDSKSNTLEKIYRSHAPKELLAIPCFSMGGKMGYDFKAYHPEFERVVEIYNAWGSSECLESEGNPRPIHSPSKGGVQEFSGGSVRAALMEGCRFGFVAGGLDDRGAFAGFFDGDQNQYTPGLTAIIASKQTRDALLEALYQRRCYATTGARIILGLYLAGQPMGSELSSGKKPGLVVNRHLSGYIAGTADLDEVELIRNGETLAKLPVNGPTLDFAYDDMEDLGKVVIPAKDDRLPFVYYYLRVIQKDEQMAWSSPIWVDYGHQPDQAKKNKKPAGK